MAAKRTKRSGKRRSRVAKGRIKSRRRNVRSRARAKKKKIKREYFIPIVEQREFDRPPLDYDEEDIEEYAALWGVSYEEAEAVLEESTDIFTNVPLDNSGCPDIDYMSELAELFDVDVSDLYDLYYGYSPGGRE